MELSTETELAAIQYLQQESLGPHVPAFGPGSVRPGSGPCCRPLLPAAAAEVLRFAVAEEGGVLAWALLQASHQDGEPLVGLQASDGPGGPVAAAEAATGGGQAAGGGSCGGSRRGAGGLPAAALFYLTMLLLPVRVS